MLQAIRGLAGFRGASFRAWVFAIARRAIIDDYRVRRKNAEVEAEEATEDHLVETKHEVRTICQCRERLTYCLTCLQQHSSLEEEAALLLADLHGSSDKASAARLSMPLSSYKWLLHRGRQRMHEHACGTCPMIGKEGLAANCARGPDSGAGASHGKRLTRRKRTGGSGLTGAQLETLCGELLRELGL
jgi:hypothetical protein